MPRTIPAVASIVLPDTRLTTPTKPVLAGSATNGGHWLDAALIHNLNAAMVHAQPCYQQGWDGGFIFVTAPATWTFSHEITVAKLTDQHTNITCRIYGFSQAGAGLGAVRFSTASAPAVFSVVTLPAGPAVWTAAATLLSVAASFGVNDYETITVEILDSVNVTTMQGEYDELSPGGAYPAGNDELASGVGPDGTVPLDTLELAADSPLPSEIARTLADGITAVSQRLRTYSSMGTIPIRMERPFRVVIPVYDLGASVHKLKFRLLAEKGGLARTHLVQHSSASSAIGFDQWKNAVASSRGFTLVTVPGGAGQHDTGDIEITLEAGDIVQAPGGYLGFAHLTLWPGPNLLSFAVWGI